MKVKESQYLRSIKPLLKRLLDLLLEKYEYVSILATDSTSKNYRVSKTGTGILEDTILSERGFVIKIFYQNQISEYSFNEISNDTIPLILNTIDTGLVSLSRLLPEAVNSCNCPIPDDSPTVFSKSTEYIESAEELGDERIIELLTHISEKGRQYDKRIVDCIAGCSYQRYHKLFLSRNKDMLQNIMWTTGTIFVLASKGEEIKTAYAPESTLGGAEVLKALESKLEQTCKTALLLLESEPIVPGEYDCICTPDVTGMIVHEAFGHGVEMDMFVKDRALAKEYIGKHVASPLITMHDGASALSEVASYYFDDEGVLAQDTIIIEKGILRTGICDSQSAMHLNLPPTGNGRRQNTERKAYTRMTNTIFEAGTDKLEDMIASVKYGFLLSNAESGMEDPKNWGIQCMVNIASEIRDGKLTGKLFSPIVLTGYVPDLLKSITMVSDITDAKGTGFCGKGYKEWVKVSDGGPYIKARIRLG